ncbi:pre-mRNA-splicing factor 38B-like isoform X2 [Branchiostoma lanceolatum]|uniref:pre-mRNA-splicing factor 38B-like isoform X1 n=2 Tax=Branchiostoma lanceolatum TaxID=7740 RepID=UPI003453D966
MPQSNVLPLWGNDKTMNLNSLILTNIQSSPYFKNDLFQLKTYHEVIDEIYYKVQHLEPWEKGSRNTGGQTGMCGGVRGVGAGGIVSTAYCLLYKLFTLKLTRKQVNGLLQHGDSPYIRGLGFMYIRYTQPPADLWEWYEPYIDDDEELDVKAGTGCMMTVGEMLRSFLGKIEWFSTLFPRIPVPIQKDLEGKLASRPLLRKRTAPAEEEQEEEETAEHIPDEEVSWGEAERRSRARRSRSSSREATKPASRTSSPAQKKRTDFERDLERERDRQRREKERPRSRSSDRPRERQQRSRSREKKRSKSQDKQSPSKTTRDRKDRRRSRSRERKRSRSRDRRRSRSRDKKRSRSQERDGGRRESDKRRSRSRERKHRSRSRDKDRKERSGSKDHKERSSSKHKDGHRDISRKEAKKQRKDRESKDRERHKERKRSRSRSKDRSHKHGKGEGKRNAHHGSDNDVEEGQIDESVQNSS